MATAKEMYAKSARILTEAKRLIRTGGSQKEITKSFKKFQKTYLACSLEYKKEKSVMVEVKTQKK